ncbi:MAG: YdeI/OmpD-associated family protein [Fibrobacteres bacterium]|nr:YdeI/OmpD-associated family protein [Fibrobacterota bacterium]
MPKRDPRIDDKIASAPAFARPILTHIRALAHKGCPETEETVKWGMPFFTYAGSPLMHMAAFKAHVVLGFWLGRLIVEEKAFETAMGQFGRITSLQDLPADKVILACIKKAMALTDQGAKNPGRSAEDRAKPKPPAKLPAFLQAAFRGDAKAAAGFKGLPPGKQREYIEWLAEAKTEATREKRLAQALEWMAEGKGRNWKYEKK